MLRRCLHHIVSITVLASSKPVLQLYYDLSKMYAILHRSCDDTGGEH